MTKEWTADYSAKNIKLTNPIFIEGLPGIANVGKIAVDFLVEELKAKKLCSFYSHSFPHSVFVNEKNLVEMPKIELYYKKFGGPRKRDLLLLTGDVQPIDEESCHSFCQEILNICQKFNCIEIITTGGIGLQNVPDKPQVYCTANDKKFLKEFDVKKLKANTKIFGVVGPIMGVSGVLIGLAQKRKIKGAALLAETFGHQVYLGIKGSKEVLRVINSKYNLKVDLKKLGQEIIEIEKEVLKKTKEWFEETSGQPQQAGAKPRKREHHYIG